MNFWSCLLIFVCLLNINSMVTYFHDATAVIEARMAVLVTFPPNAPPILLTWQVTLLDGMFSVSATASCSEENKTDPSKTQKILFSSDLSMLSSLIIIIIIKYETFLRWWKVCLGLSRNTHLTKTRRLGGDVNVELLLLADGNNQHALSLHVEMLLAAQSNLSWGTKRKAVPTLLFKEWSSPLNISQHIYRFCKTNVLHVSSSSNTFINPINTFKGLGYISPLKHSQRLEERGLFDGLLSQCERKNTMRRCGIQVNLSVSVSVFTSTVKTGSGRSS